MTLKTCRFCHHSNFDYNHPDRDSHWICYASRCNAHLSCMLRSKGIDFVLSLPTHKLESFPFFEVTKLGFASLLRDELAKRATMHPQVQAGIR